MKINRASLFLISRFCIVLALLATCVFGQGPIDSKTVLASFERKIEDGKTSEVESNLFNFVVANPKDARGFSLLGKLRFRQNRLTEAKSLLSKALSIDPALISAKVSLARVVFQLNDIDGARAVINGIADADVTDSSTRLTVAETAALVGECRTALLLAEKLPVNIRNGKGLPLQATCFLATGDSQSFAALIPLSKTLARSNAAAAIEFAGVLNKAAMYGETTELLRLVIAVAPKNVGALMLLTRAEIALKDYSKARVHLVQAEKLEPQSSEVIFVGSVLESEQGNNEKALGLLERLLAQDPVNTQTLSQFVVVALRANQNGKAMRAAEKLLALQPANLEFLYLLGISSLQNNNLPQAESSLTKFLKARPTDSLGCLALGLTFAAQPDRIDEARGQLEKCLVITPGNFEATYQLALSYKVQGDTAKAIDYFEQTVKLAPNYAAALRDLGAVYLQAGIESKARPVLEKAASIAPNDAEVHFQLSRLYNLIGERELAQKQLDLFQKLKNPKKDGM